MFIESCFFTLFYYDNLLEYDDYDIVIRTRVSFLGKKLKFKIISLSHNFIEYIFTKVCKYGFLHVSTIVGPAGRQPLLSPVIKSLNMTVPSNIDYNILTVVKLEWNFFSVKNAFFLKTVHD